MCAAGGAVLQRYLETHGAPAGVLLAFMPPACGRWLPMGNKAAVDRLVTRTVIAAVLARLSVAIPSAQASMSAFERRVAAQRA